MNVIQLERPHDIHQLIDVMNSWKSPIRDLNLPSAPDFPLQVFEAERYPQPRLHADNENGIQTAVGRIRQAEVNDINFIAMAHNTSRGAAGGAILNAELLVKKGYIK